MPMSTHPLLATFPLQAHTGKLTATATTTPGVQPVYLVFHLNLTIELLKILVD